MFQFPVALSAVWNINETPCLSGGPMFSDVYRFDKLIFKWGACDHTGSEHTTDGQFYALERQMIFRRDNMSSTLSLGESVRVGHCNNPDCNMKNCNQLRHVSTGSVCNCNNTDKEIFVQPFLFCTDFVTWRASPNTRTRQTRWIMH